MVTISVIIATYDRNKCLTETLDSLLMQDCEEGFDYEVIIVDNNSKSPRKDILEPYIRKFKGKIVYLSEPKQGKCFAVNTGIKNAKGDIIALTDDDIVADKYWLSNIYRCFKKYNCDGVGGRILPLYPPNTPNWIKENKELLNGPIIFRDYGEGDINYRETKMLPFIGANMSYTKACFKKYGLFSYDLDIGTHNGLGDDTEFFRRLIKDKAKLYYCGGALIRHPYEKNRLNFQYITAWFFDSGRTSIRETYREEIAKNHICYFGIPRYMIKEVLKFSLRLIISIPSRNKLLKNWRVLNIFIGKCYECNRLHSINRKKNNHKPFKVAVVTGVFPKLSETFILTQITELIDLGHSVDILAFRRLKEKAMNPDIIKYKLIDKLVIFDIPENRVTRLIKAATIIINHFIFHPKKIIKCLDLKKYGGKYYALNNLFILAHFLNRKYNVIHCHFGPIANKLIFLKDILPKIKFITSFHGYDVRLAQNGNKEMYANLFKKTEHVLVNCDYMKQILKDLGCHNSKIIYNQSGIDTEKFRRDKKDKKKSHFVITTVARLVNEKNILATLDMIHSLKQTNAHKFRYYLIGDGYLKADIKNKISELGLHDTVIMWGALPQNKVIQKLNETDIFLLLSREEMFGNVLLEAQSMNIPVIASNVGGMNEAFEDGITGYSVSINNIYDAQSRILHLTNTPSLIENMGKSGRDFVVKNFNRDKLSNRLIEIYRRAISN